MPQSSLQSTFVTCTSVNGHMSDNTSGNQNNNSNNDNRHLGHVRLRASNYSNNRAPNDHFEVDNDSNLKANATFNDPCSVDSFVHGFRARTNRQQQPLEQLQEQHIYENTKFDLRFSQKLLLHKLFPNRETGDVIYENLCQGCGYGVFESQGKLCNFCACIVNGLKSRQLRESVESKRVLVDTGENIYENICGKCSALYNSDECESCAGRALPDGGDISEASTALEYSAVEASDVKKVTKPKSFQKGDKRNLLYGLLGSLKRSVKSSHTSRKQLNIIHNVDGFNNVFCTQDTFDLKRMCELKRSQSSDQPIYGRLKRSDTDKSSNCSSVQTLPSKLEYSQSHEKLFHISCEDTLDNAIACETSSTSILRPLLTSTLANKNPFRGKRPRISKPRLLCSLPHNSFSKFNTDALETSELFQPPTTTKLSIYLSDSVCHWMTLLRHQVNKYFSFGVPVDDESYALCVPKSIPSRCVSINYSNGYSINTHDILVLGIFVNDEEAVTKYDKIEENPFTNLGRSTTLNCIDEYNECTLRQMVDVFKYNLMRKQKQQQNDQKQQRSYQQCEEQQQPAIDSPSTGLTQSVTATPTAVPTGLWLSRLREQQAKFMSFESDCRSEHRPTLDTIAQVLLGGSGERGLTSCCANCHVITVAGNCCGFLKCDSSIRFVNKIQYTLCSSEPSHASKLRFETGCGTVNTCEQCHYRKVTRASDKKDGVAAVSAGLNSTNFNNNLVTLVSVADHKDNKTSTNYTEAGFEIEKSSAEKHLQLCNATSTILSLDVCQTIRGSLLSNSLNKIVIFYDKQLIAFLRKNHHKLYGALYTDREQNQFVRKYERFCAHFKRILVAQSGASRGNLWMTQDADGGGSVSVDITADKACGALDESVVEKVDNCETRGNVFETISDIARSQIVANESLKDFTDDVNENANAIKKSTGGIDQDNLHKMKANNEVVLRPKSKEHVGRNKKAQGTFLDSTNGASFPEWTHDKSCEKCNIPNETESTGPGDSPECENDNQISPEKQTMLSSPSSEQHVGAALTTTSNDKYRGYSEKEEDIYQPIWKFKTVGAAEERYEIDADYYDKNSAAAVAPNAIASKSSEPHDSSSMRFTNVLAEECVEDHGEWETDDEFMFTKQPGGEGCDGADTTLSSSVEYLSGMGQSLLSGVSGSTAGSTITGFESSTATLASATSSSLQHSILRSVGIFYSLTEPQLRAIIYDYDRVNTSLYFNKNHSSLLQQYAKGLSVSQNRIKLSGTNIEKTVKEPLSKSSLHCIESNVPIKVVQKVQLLPDSVQAWKFMLLDVCNLEDEEDMIVAESEILRAQQFRENTDTQMQHAEQQQQLNVLQRFKSASFGNLVDLPIEDDKKSIAERMRNKLQRGVFKLNMRSPKSEKKSRGVFRRMETGSLYLEEGMKPKYPMFGAPLDQLEMDEATHPHVPRFVVDCIAFIEQKCCILQDGLYRASGNKVAIDELKQKLTDSYIYDSRLLVTDDIHTLTSLLKQFFRELPVPLIPQHTYERFGRRIADMAGIEQIREAFEGMCEPNRSTLKFLIRHLKNVAAYSIENRMPASNLAIVWGPCIFSANQVEFVDIGRMNTLAKVLIENYERIFSESERLVS